MEITALPIWQELREHQDGLRDQRINDLFADDPDRATRMTVSGAGLTLDYSKHLANPRTFGLLFELARAAGLGERRARLFAGDTVNESEGRAALHTLLRNATASTHPAAEDVRRTLERMRTISTAIAGGQWRGATGKRIKHCLHIGVGGSYLGPRMAAEALSTFRENDIQGHYVANIDGHHIDDVLSGLPAEETVVVVVSKTFTTLETRTNANTASAWLKAAMPGADLAGHIIAVSTNIEAAREFGASAENILPLWDFVGGRYSLWSAVGLPIAITHGFRVFTQLLAGARAMDEHFLDAPSPSNLPLIAALLSVWYNNFFGAVTHAVIPYDHFLRLLPAHLQQLDMESLGKRVAQNGDDLNLETGQIVWGGEGSNGQHAFHQLLHQGTRLTPVDFILPLTPHHRLPDHHEWLVANCFGQAEALMTGYTPPPEEDPPLAAHRTLPGNRPSSMILMASLTPQTLGALIALYEHKVFCQAAIWQINPFDQWGVEYGKVLSERIHARMTGAESPLHPATEHLLDQYRAAAAKR